MYNNNSSYEEDELLVSALVLLFFRCNDLSLLLFHCLSNYRHHSQNIERGAKLINPVTVSSRARATATNNDIMVQPRQIRDNLISSHAFIYWIEAVVEAIEAALCIYIVCCSMMKYHLQCN